jgi:hypothetical protein
MKKIEFTVHGEPLIGSSVDIEGIVTTDEDPRPIAVPIRYNDHLIHMPVAEGVMQLHIEFATESTVTVAPGDDYEGETLVLRADRAA